MSLLEESFEKFTVLNKVKIPDEYGGTKTKYVDGIDIYGAMIFDSSMQARIAGAQGVSSVYTLTTKKNVMLEYHDVIRRARDNKVFRITSDGDDKYTPSSAGLDMRQVIAEEWIIPPED